MDILLVEDNSTLANLFRVQLKQLGDHTLTTSANRASAIQAFKNGTFDLVFVDMGLDGYQDGGLKVLAEIKTLTPHQRVGILSSNDLRDTVRLSQKGGAEFYMVKPFTQEGLALVLTGDKEAIRNHLPEISEGRIIAF
jgi:CheY-like chemotaxis protein